MLFSSFLFIFLFLPMFFFIFYISKPTYRNLIIFLGSLLFYFYGEHVRTLILIFSIFANFTVGYLLSKNMALDPNGKPIPTQKSRIILFSGVLINLGLLAYFKYAGFLTENLNHLLAAVHSPWLAPAVNIALPLGISFFAFQGISYIMDVYRGDIKPTGSIFTFGTYKLMFPQLIAGPIVRYANVANDMDNRHVHVDQVFEGITRFSLGLMKKVLIADTMAQVVNDIFSLPNNELSFGIAWLGAIAYTFQIYFDFSAYSDMAIGMGRMMGFKYPENFNYPYISTSIREFWRRWHITLSSWFRDYVYIPLGGNRIGPARTYGNLLFIFFLTGLWHGASWTFVAWGMWHGAFMLLERWSDPDKWRIPKVLKHAYLLLVVIFGWVLFRATSFKQALAFFGNMLGIKQGNDPLPIAAYLDPQVYVFLIVATLFSMPIYHWMRKTFPENQKLIWGTITICFGVILCSMKILAGSYSPFLYFRF
ncbi:MAG: MBOAT family protein [Gammaproteobacteria bacterium]